MSAERDFIQVPGQRFPAGFDSRTVALYLNFEGNQCIFRLVIRPLPQVQILSSCSIMRSNTAVKDLVIVGCLRQCWRIVLQVELPIAAVRVRVRSEGQKDGQVWAYKNATL